MVIAHAAATALEFESITYLNNLVNWAMNSVGKNTSLQPVQSSVASKPLLPLALSVQRLSKSVALGDNNQLDILKAISFSLAKGGSLAIVGRSGSGKTTLLGLLAGLDVGSQGEVELLGKQLSKLSEDERAQLRAEHVGFVFQSFQLLPTLNALENVALPLELQGEPLAEQKAVDILNDLGLADRMAHYPAQMSGGEQQRVALARAFACSPDILFADEPTGNLDSKTGERIIEALFERNRSLGTTLVLVTHDMELARRCESIIHIDDGRLIKQEQGADVRSQNQAQDRTDKSERTRL